MAQDFTDPFPPLDRTCSLVEPMSLADGDPICNQFIEDWKSGQQPRIEDYLGSASASERNVLLLKLLSVELSLRRQAGESLTLDRYLSRFPNDQETVAQAFAQTDRPVDHNSTYSLVRSFDSETHSFSAAEVVAKQRPSTSARYRKVRKLGEGAFGAVWLAEDLELKRQVALKEPRPDRLQHAADIETYLAEARVLASLDHPHIVPVYDVGRTAGGSCYVVSKLIDGTDLAAYVKQKSTSFAEAASLVAQIAEALQHTHNRGLVHRDIKPANILIDGQNRPYVTDFGLALRDEDFGKQEGIAGTPAYMSPEQARGESHLVDGRSDIFSLGVVLFELLSGCKPFLGDNWGEILQRITTVEAKPLRQLNEAIPKELERICLKALSKRATDRYSCAADLAEDLRNWCRPTAADQTSLAPVKIVPKGLRSFDAADSDFFLELLPGPRDRGGLPESLRFWKTRIEETDAERTFRVGLVYGPSGCGKSSMMKAGLLPRLSDHVIRVFLEATPDRTEQQLLHGLRRACPDLPRDASLVDTLAAIRRGNGIPAGRKVVLVVDQFEQWLYSHGAETNSELSAALRQCDGGRIQAVLLVRDDFWMPATRMLKALETPLIDGHNAAAVDLFDLLHARKVLSEFGKAYGRLPENLENISRDQDSFLTQSVTGLSQDGKVISVRLALFSDMMKSRPWTPAALTEVGGTTGVGATFLEETFSSRTAPPQHRLHQEAARAVLRALLPTTGTEIKGHMRSASELQEACGYSNRPQDFAELICILDSEVRLITPVGSEEGCVNVEVESEKYDASDVSNFQPPNTPSFYQLTHDYLVPSLRDWLTRKQRETRRGRAELQLEERAKEWNVKQQSRHLPSITEYFQFQLLGDHGKWTITQQSMMKHATRFYSMRAGIVASIITTIGLIGFAYRKHIDRQRESDRIAFLVSSLESAQSDKVPEIISEINNSRQLAVPVLTHALGTTKSGSNQELYLQVALLPSEKTYLEKLRSSLVSVPVDQFPIIRDSLLPYADYIIEPLWSIALSKDQSNAQRFRAASALAAYCPADPRWQSLGDFVVDRLIALPPTEFVAWKKTLVPVKEVLCTPLANVFRNPSAELQQKNYATELLAEFLADRPDALFDLVADADSNQFPALFAKLADHPKQARESALAELAKVPSAVWNDRSPLPSWESIDEKQSDLVTQSNGFVHGSFAICLSMSLDKAIRLSEELKPLGFRPIRLRPYHSADLGILCAAIWVQDGLDHLIIPSLTKSELKERATSCSSQGFRIIDVSSYSQGGMVGEAAEQYLLLCEQIQGSRAENEFAAGIAPEENAATWKGFRSQGLKIATIDLNYTSDNKLLSSYVWDHLPGRWSFATGTLHDLRDAWKGQLIPSDISVIAPAKDQSAEDAPRIEYGMAFEEVEAADTEIVAGVPIADCGRIYYNLAVAGYRPISVDACSNDNQIEAAAIWRKPRVSDDILEAWANRRASAAIILSKLGDPEQIWSILGTSGLEPRPRTYLIHKLRDLDVNPQVLVSQYAQERDVAKRAGLLLALSEYDPTQLDHETRGSLARKLYSTYAQEPSQSVRAAMQYLLQTWDETGGLDSIPPDVKAGLSPTGAKDEWFVNSQGHTMVVIEPAEYTMGSPSWESDRDEKVETRHRRRISNRFAIAAYEVTKKQFDAFLADSPWVGKPSIATFVRTEDSPQVSMTWYEAAAYCNWLSQQEGIPKEQWCYQPNRDGLYASGMKAMDRLDILTGYRLPTEAEWEFACRAGASTSRYYGNTPRLLPRYALHVENGREYTSPVGRFKPNNFGLFDMLGNVFEWTHSPFTEYPFGNPEAIEDRIGKNIEIGNTGMILRGGGFAYKAIHVRTAFRYIHPPEDRYSFFGFRVAKTHKP